MQRRRWLLISFSLPQRQAQGESGPLSLTCCFGTDKAAVVAHNLPAYSKANALAVLLGGEERGENVVAHLGRQPATIILHGHREPPLVVR